MNENADNLDKDKAQMFHHLLAPGSISEKDIQMAVEFLCNRYRSQMLMITESLQG